MGLFDRIKAGIQIVVGGVSQGRVIVKGSTINSGATRPKQGEEWLHAYNTMPWLRANVSKIANGVSGLEWGITRTTDDHGMTVKRPDLQHGGLEYRRKMLAAMSEEGKAEAIFDHPMLALWKNPCPALPGGAARKLAQVYYEIVGEVFFVVDRGPRDGYLKSDFTGRPLPTALWPVPPQWVKRVPTPDNPTFEIRYGGLQMMNIPQSEVLWLKDADPVNPYSRGVGLFFALSDELDSDENAARMVSYSFYNRNRPDLLVSLPGASDQELMAFRNDWIANVQGVQNTLKNHFVNVEANVQQIGYDFREMQVNDLRKFTRDIIRQVPGIPPEMLGIQDQSNRATIDAAEYIFSRHVIEPRAEVWREFLGTHLLVEYDPRAILDYVSPTQEDKNFTLNVVTGRPEIAKINEIRKLAGLPALTPEEGGELFFVPTTGTFAPTLTDAMNQAAAAAAAPPPGPGGPPGTPGDATGLSHPGMEGGINVPGHPQMHLSVPGAAGSAESGLPHTGGPAPAAGAAGGQPAGMVGSGTTVPAPDGMGPGFALQGRPKDAIPSITKIHKPHIVAHGRGFKVVDVDGHVYGTHPSRGAAEAQLAALYAAKDSEKGVAAVAARRFRRGIVGSSFTPDQSLALSKWAKLNDYDLDFDLIAKRAPIPLTENKGSEWVRRLFTHLDGQSTKAWDPMFGPWSAADDATLDELLKGYEDQPRDDRGRWAEGPGGVGDAGAGGVRPGFDHNVTGDATHPHSRALALVKRESLTEALQPANGGFSVNVVSGESLKVGQSKGFMVARYPERSLALPLYRMNARTLARFAKKNEDLLSKPGHFFGGWHDPESGKVWLDVAERASSHEEAVRLCHQHDQLAYFDMEKGETIRVEGTTGGPASKGLREARSELRRGRDGGVREGDVQGAPRPGSDGGRGASDRGRTGVLKGSPDQPRDEHGRWMPSEGQHLEPVPTGAPYHEAKRILRMNDARDQRVADLMAGPRASGLPAMTREEAVRQLVAEERKRIGGEALDEERRRRGLMTREEALRFAERVRRAKIRKGDVEGHPFHGNQYADVAGGGQEESASTPRGQAVAPDTPVGQVGITSEPVSDVPDPPGAFRPNVEADSNGDGVTDSARVGVPADEVPPPPTVPRLPNLTPQERQAETEFATAYEKDPEKFARAYIDMVKADPPATFEADAAKKLYGAWKGEGLSEEQRAEVRSTLNTALHQTADAIAKKALLMHLDEMSDDERKKGMLVTVGGCGAGKGYALKTLAANGYTDFNKMHYGVIWDSAGDQNATENPWLLSECQKRGIPVTYAYISSDPETAWADPKRGVVQRAEDPKDGRMVDASVFADSYVLGARNHDAFSKHHAGEATFVYVKNGAKIEKLSGVPASDIARDRKALHEFAVKTIRDKAGIKPRIRRGALVGERIWANP